MSITAVSTTAELVAALKSAADGDVILLEPGSYSGVVLRDLDFDCVKIQSKDPANPAVFTDLMVRNASGLDFSNIEFQVDPNKPYHSFQVFGSRDIHFDRLDVHGSLNGNPDDDKSGLMIRESSNVSVRNSEFHELDNAVQHLDCEFLVFEGNKFHDIQTDGIRGGGSSNVKVLNNHFTDFYPQPGDHPDAVQFWTGRTEASARNIEVSGNVVVRGSGGPVQGIFFRDQGDVLPYQNVTITNNIVIGGLGNGIMVDGGRNVQITDNTVISLPGQKSYIRVENVDLGVVASNTAMNYLYINSTRVTELKNSVNTFVQDGGADALKKWIAGPAGSISTTTVKEPEPVEAAPVEVGQPGAQAAQKLAGTAGADRLTGGLGADTLMGGAGDDVLTGGAGHDDLRADTGADTLRGDAGNDKLNGGDGADLLYGGDGSDQLEGGRGADTMVGGSGADRFFYRHEHVLDGSTDVIQGFSAAEGDKILLSMIDANTTTATNDKFVFIGTNGFSGKAGELRYETKDGNVLVSADLNGDKIADFKISITNTASIAAGDFAL